MSSQRPPALSGPDTLLGVVPATDGSVQASSLLVSALNLNGVCSNKEVFVSDDCSNDLVDLTEDSLCETRQRSAQAHDTSGNHVDKVGDHNMLDCLSSNIERANKVMARHAEAVREVEVEVSRLCTENDLLRGCLITTGAASGKDLEQLLRSSQLIATGEPHIEKKVLQGVVTPSLPPSSGPPPPTDEPPKMRIETGDCTAPASRPNSQAKKVTLASSFPDAQALSRERESTTSLLRLSLGANSSDRDAEYAPNSGWDSLAHSAMQLVGSSRACKTKQGISMGPEETQVPQGFQVLPVWATRVTSSWLPHSVKRSWTSGIDDYSAYNLSKRLHQAKAAKTGISRSGTSAPKEVDDRDPTSYCVKSAWGVTDSVQSRRHRLEALVVLHPYSSLRGFWDLLSLILVTYDMVMIPLALFELPAHVVLDSFAWLTRIFWTIDMYMSCTTGIVTSDGTIELRLWKCLKKYLRTWALLDALIVSTDWLEILLSTSNSIGYARMGKASRIVRIVRMLRLLRLFRIREVLSLMVERIQSERLIIAVKMMQLTTMVVFVAHVIACIWYGIGASDNRASWVEEYKFSRAALLYKYTMALHWSLSQFTGGMDEVTPCNTVERLYAIVVFLFAFVSASVFVSTITSCMTELHIIGSAESRQISVLRRYLYQNGITNKLALRVQRNAKNALLEQQRLMPEDKVELLSMISEPLHVELHYEMYSPVFGHHPFFAVYMEECPQVMRKVCHYATNFSLVSAGDVIFSHGEIPATPKMIFVVSGECAYKDVFGHVPVNVNMWVSEASLWTRWMHLGTLTANAESRLCYVDAKKFQDIATQFSHNDFDPRSYAQEFVATLNAETHVSDLPLEEWGERGKVDGLGSDPKRQHMTGFHVAARAVAKFKTVIVKS